MCTFYGFPLQGNVVIVTYSTASKAGCPGMNVTVTCTVPAQTHHWSIPDLNIARSLSVGDRNRTVADPPFLFNVTDVRQTESITVIT